MYAKHELDTSGEPIRQRITTPDGWEVLCHVHYCTTLGCEEFFVELPYGQTDDGEGTNVFVAKQLYHPEEDDEIKTLFQDIAIKRIDIFMRDCVEARAAERDNRLN